jgi:hypothetical protein
MRRRNGPVSWYRGAVVAPDTASTLAEIRRALTQPGKVAATYRFTKEEKRALRELVYTYGGAGVHTSENEITRIAVNWLLEDHRRRGQDSVLAQVLGKPEE